MSDPVGQPASERIEKAGRTGWRFADGAILWDDGEKEIPTSGISDEAKRAEARRQAGDAPELSKKGVSQAEINAVTNDLALLSDPEKLLQSRKAAAKERAGRKPAPGERELPPSDVELQHNARISVKKLLERELDRTDELKNAAIAGQLELGRSGIKVPGGNPPMQLHEAMLTAMRVSDSGTAEQMLMQLQSLRGWHALDLSDADPGLPNPPSGMPLPPVVIPPDPDSGTIPQASRVTGPGGKPTEYPPAPPLPDPLP